MKKYYKISKPVDWIDLRNVLVLQLDLAPTPENLVKAWEYYITHF